MTNPATLKGSDGPAGPDRRRRPGPSKRARIYNADDWHVDDGVGTDGKARYHKSGIRRSFSPEYKLAILAEYDGCSETGEKGAILRREGLYSSLITRLASPAPPGPAEGRHRTQRRRPRRPEPSRGREAEGGERTAPAQARPGRSDHRGPGESARALGGDLQERGPRRRLNARPRRRRRRARRPRRPPQDRVRRAGPVPGQHYRTRRPPLHGPPAPRARPARALTTAEADEVDRGA